ncbi:hypothetical protein HMPREF3056_07235 [Corynebacterium sp. HMSC056F09]|uniref:Uncharacterized protein n=1 Tax=Corynebacterium aurimucosum TaxID=169292 RepID=A0A6I3KA36_9CORY|nr:MULTISPECIES: hypothetical protein [Corynebacterium]MTD90652.1 hypothetical protein [Corynebacterium aurimucosum]OFO22080.1 hypothetical protein HMPREF3056_07235 [Corynebacterium sp. HMSC056F09]
MGLDFFRRGRGLTLLAAGTGVLLIAAIVVGEGLASRVLLVGAALLGVFFAAMSISARKHAEGLIKESLRRSVRLQKQLKSLSDAAQEQNRLAERQPLNTLTAGFTDKEENQGRHPHSVFAPATIPASRIIARPTAHTAGRIAADQEMNEDSADVLHTLMNAPSDAWTRKVEIIGSPCVEECLREVAEVSRIRAPHLLGKPDPDASHLIVDENQLERGLWSGLLSTQKTIAFLDLLEHVAKAKENGAVVVVQASDTSNHFTDELRSQATVVVRGDSAAWDWEGDIHSPVIQALRHNEAPFVKENGLNLTDKGES